MKFDKLFCILCSCKFIVLFIIFFFFSKVPTFNKKEEIFQTLCEYAVPNIRAAWFIKMIAAHNMGTQDARNRRKASVDQSMGKNWKSILTIIFLILFSQNVRTKFAECCQLTIFSFVSSKYPPDQLKVKTISLLNKKLWHNSVLIRTLICRCR